MADNKCKEVLVRLGIRKRRVKFVCHTEPSEEKYSLIKAIRDVYKDVLTESENFVIHIKSEQFHGEFEELLGDMKVDTNSVVEVSVEEKTHKDEVQAETSKAQGYCARVGKVPSEKNAVALKKNFPAFYGNSKKRKFDPTAACVVADQQKKKKSTNTRIKPRTFNIVLLPKITIFVPKGYQRSKLTREGRILKLVFRRNMSSEDVRSTILDGFSDLCIEKVLFLTCGQDNRLRALLNNDVDGDGLFDLAGQGSVYILSDESTLDDSIEGVSSGVPMALSSENPTHVGESSGVPMALSENSTLVGELSGVPVALSEKSTLVGELSGVPVALSENPTHVNENNETLEQRRSIILEQDKAYNESLQADREKVRKKEEDKRTKKRVGDIRISFEDMFECDGTEKIAFQFPGGVKVQHKFPDTSTVKDLYRFALKKGAEPPFSLTSYPREMLAVGDDSIISHCLDGSVLIIESCDEEIDKFLDVLELKQTEEPKCPDSLFQSQELQKSRRVNYMTTIGSSAGPIHVVERSNVFEDLLNVYKVESIVTEYPVKFEFKGEIGVDQGGITRDVFSAFWEYCYSMMFDGSMLLIPMLSPQTDTSVLPILGRILSHAYLVSGFLPVRVALPCLLRILCGPCVDIPHLLLCDAFLDYISATERVLFKDALSSTTFSPEMQEGLLSTLSRFSCRQMPTPSNLKTCLIQVAQFEFCCKPAAAISMLYSGIPALHSTFWKSQHVEGLQSLYDLLTVSPKKVIEILDVSFAKNPAEERVGGYLVEMIGNMSTVILQRFLRFTTGSSVLIVDSITVEFNRLSGLGRRPCAHTCDCTLELPVEYNNYNDFHTEWMAILNSDDTFWKMDCI